MINNDQPPRIVPYIVTWFALYLALEIFIYGVSTMGNDVETNTATLGEILGHVLGQLSGK